MELERPEVKDAAPLPELAGLLQPAESALNLPDQADGEIQPVVSGQDPSHVQAADSLN